MMKSSIDIDTVKGFLDPKEGHALYSYALQAGALGPVLEVGSYCGKSTVYLGEACREKDVSLYAIDHHRGSEEHQPGEEYHDQDLFDGKAGLMDTFREFRQTMRNAALEDVVVPIVASSSVASRNWHTPLGMVFIDGGHSLEAAQTDYRSWVSHVVTDGILAIHDIFPDPAEGGQAPHEILKLAVASGLFEEVDRVKTLGILRRL
jgi:predicted O-methyltransferase YrrM